MKKLLPIFAAASLIALSASATVHSIQVGDFQFTPANPANVHVGDTVQWVWNAGFHTTTSTTIPAGAAAWDEPMTAAKTFNYRVAVAGTYHYKCTPHESMGMTGTFTATSASGISTAGADALFRMYPNPAAGNLRIELADTRQPVTVTITDALGRTISSVNYAGSKTVDIPTAAFANGIYTIRATMAGKEYAQSFEVAH